MSNPTVRLEPPAPPTPVSCRFVKITPTSERPKTLRRSLTTLKFSAASPSNVSLWMLRRPTSISPILPVRRAPPVSGTGVPPRSPIWREWKSVKSRNDVLERGTPGTRLTSPKENVPEFSKKNSRCSGKKSGKRVRFTCSASASTCEKSVRYVRSSVRFGVMPYFRSSPASASAPRRSSASVAPLPFAVSANGFTVRLLPAGRRPRPFRVPALDIRKIRFRRSSGAQYVTSFLRRTRLKMFSPHD